MDTSHMEGTTTRRDAEIAPELLVLLLFDHFLDVF